MIERLSKCLHIEISYGKVIINKYNSETRKIDRVELTLKEFNKIIKIQ